MMKAANQLKSISFTEPIKIDRSVVFISSPPPLSLLYESALARRSQWWLREAPIDRSKFSMLRGVWNKESFRNWIDVNNFCYSLSECYFAGKGAALVLPPNERARPSRRVSTAGCDIQQHLQSMFYLLRPEETLKMVSFIVFLVPEKQTNLGSTPLKNRASAEVDQFAMLNEWFWFFPRRSGTHNGIDFTVRPCMGLFYFSRDLFARRLFIHWKKSCVLFRKKKKIQVTLAIVNL